jgi:hypothetical protein
MKKVGKLACCVIFDNDDMTAFQQGLSVCMQGVELAEMQ